MLGDDLASRPTRHSRSRVLRLRGLPYRAVEEDIRQFFTPIAVTRVYLCRRNGRSTGEAYAEFEDSPQAGEALRVKNRQHLGNRYIELFEAGQSDFERLVATDTGAHTGASLQATPAIKVVGLPATASRQGIVDFLSGIEVLHGADSVTIISEQDASTSAVVQLANAAAQLQAINRSNTLFGERPVQVLPCDAVTGAAVSSSGVAGPSDLFAAQQSLISGSEQPVSAQQAQSFPFDTDGATLKLRGLPYSADETDVIAFFEGFQVGRDDVHLEVRQDHPSQRTGTGIAYVQFSSPEEAERARHSRHKQMMGPRYIECMVFVPGRHYLARGSPVAASGSTSWPQFQPPARPFLPPASTAFGFNAALPSNAAAFGDNAALDQRLQSAGLPRPLQGLDARPFSPDSFNPAQAMRSHSGSLRQSIEQANAAAEGRAGEQPHAGAATSLQPASAMHAAGAGPAVRPLPFGLTPQQQHLMLQQQFAMQQQQQLLLQQQAMQAQWGNLQQGAWLRAFPPMPLGLAPGGPLQLPPQGPLQGGLGLPGQPLAYYAPGTPYGWTAMHPGQAMLGQGLQNFPVGQQPQRPFLRSGQLGVDQRQAVHSPFGSSRTPGRGRFKTPFTQALSAPSALPQDSGFEQPLAGDAQAVRLPGIESGPAESSTSASHSALSLAATVSDLKRLSLADDMTATRLRPVATHTAPSPSDVIRASAARGSSPEASPAVFPLLSGQIYCQGMPSSSPQPVQVPGVPGPTPDDARAAVIPGSSLTSSAPATSEE